jgi:hypothetical protein
VIADVGRDGKLHGRQLHRVHPPPVRRVLGRPVHQHVSAADLEQRVVVHASRRAERLTQRRVELCHGAGIPAQDVVQLDIAFDGSNAHSRDGAHLDPHRRWVRRQQPTQRPHRSPGPVELGLQAVEVLGDELGPRSGVCRVEDAPDGGERDVEVPQPMDDLRGGDLLGCVVAVPGQLVDVGRDQQVRLVVPAQRAHAQVGQSGELPDAEVGVHPRSLHSLPGGESSA